MAHAAGRITVQSTLGVIRRCFRQSWRKDWWRSVRLRRDATTARRGGLSRRPILGFVPDYPAGQGEKIFRPLPAPLPVSPVAIGEKRRCLD